MTYTDIWPLHWTEFWGSPGATEFPPGGQYTVRYGVGYDLEAAAPGPQAARERDLWQLFVRNDKLQIVAEISDYKHASLVVRASATGAFVIDLPRGSDAATKLLDAQSGVVAMRNGEVILSGPVRYRNRVYRDGESILSVSGPDDVAVLDGGLGYPEPNHSDPPFNTLAYDVRSGVASTVILDFIDANIGANAVSSRRNGNLHYTDPAVGSVITDRSRFNTLAAVIRKVCSLSTPNLAFRCRQLVENQLNTRQVAVEVFVPQDRTTGPGKVVFSTNLGNLVSYEYEETAGPNVLIGGGQGELADRDFAPAADLNAVLEWGRIEAFADHRDAGSHAELLAATQADLVDQATQFAISLDLTESATFRWRENFDVGDRVIVNIEEGIANVIAPNVVYQNLWPPSWPAHWGYLTGSQHAMVQAASTTGIQLVEVIREVEVKLEQDKATVTPRVASAGAKLNPNETRLFKAVRDLQSQLAALQRTK